MNNYSKIGISRRGISSKAVTNPCFGFTLIELLVVMVIIAMLAALLLPAIRKARSKAMVDKAKSEMANLAGIETVVKGDLGWYIRLCDLKDGDLAPMTHAGYPVANGATNGNDLPGNYTLAYTDGTSDSTNVESELTLGTGGWDGPYQVFQEKSVFVRGTQGSTSDPGSATGWDMAKVADGMPLDPWGHPYLLAYRASDKVMIIYSSGPNGTLETNAGDVIQGGDDILYKFR